MAEVNVRRALDERCEEILETIDAAESPGWFQTRTGVTGHYDTGHGVALCGVGHLVRRAREPFATCIRCDAMLAARQKDTP